MKKNRIAIIGTVGIPAKYGGFETLTEQLVSNLSDEFDFTVYCSKKKYSKEERISHYKGAKLEYINLEANGVQSILYDCISILKSLKNNDILLILGVAGAFMLPFIKLFTNKKIIISIDGIEWKRDKWSFFAKFYLFWAEKMAVKYSHFDISDNESIQDYTAMRYETLSKVIEYGADHTLQVKPNQTDYLKYTFLNGNYAVKVCRIEPENNIHVVLNAFSLNSNTNLVVIGNWENNEYGKSLKIKYSAFKNIFLYDPIYDQREIDLIRGNATFYVHGHSAGGTNPSLVEAMFLGLPVVSFNVSYNKTTTENKALYFSNELELTKIIQNVTKNDLKTLGLKMKSIADRRYKWEIIAEKYKQLFIEVRFAGKKTSLNNPFSVIKNDTLDELNLSHLKYTNTFYEKR
ncbi:glycosyltransferase family 1 protein [Flavobacterium sp. F372]|uniref:DUF1972 domain-containing protein n=1 Tax=Flavobacterium bernardetii TaxID=2813823 RepID=A0ABR7J121_9FLAO|nr:DUF1972 domain-containing protein [Flavobacterium bernardetii]MBC5835764.1 DUF1972 domain-containing protein [Flavobacterium bernardetii]NHF69495.1 glycosyltransferase family 1 protein [Flavobacterium bernardetii]